MKFHRTAIIGRIRQFGAPPTHHRCTSRSGWRDVTWMSRPPQAVDNISATPSAMTCRPAISSSQNGQWTRAKGDAFCARSGRGSSPTSLPFDPADLELRTVIHSSDVKQHARTSLMIP